MLEIEKASQGIRTGVGLLQHNYHPEIFLMRTVQAFALIASAVLLTSVPAGATILSVSGPLSLRGGSAQIISPPPDVNDNAAFNIAQQGFDEVQNFLLPVDITVDGGIISAGTVISSHMIFINNSVQDGNILNEHEGVEWTFDGDVLGVMSDYLGSLEIATSALLGAGGTVYPVATFNARGMEVDDSYSFLANVLTVNTRIRQPGDWIRVITSASDGNSVPEPASMLLFSAGLLGLGLRRKLN